MNCSKIKSKYKNVVALETSNKGKSSIQKYWQATIKRNNKRILNKCYKTEKEAAKAVDLTLIKLGENPVNGFYKKI